jgi:GNAT superfamily N-acetyltransferase
MGPLPGSVSFHPVTPPRWGDLETLFGEHGAYSGCWCMWWRLTAAQFSSQVGPKNKAALKAIVDSGEVPGILAYMDGRPAGWCSVGPRERFGRIERSPVLKRADDEAVWSIVCYYVDKSYRRQGLMQLLTVAAIDYAKTQGAGIVEAYPSERAGPFKGTAAYTGVSSVFRGLGFVEVLRRRPHAPILRYYLNETPKPVTGQ